MISESIRQRVAQRSGDLKVLGGLFVLVTVLLFFVSPDSYLYDLHSRIDSAWFFMCGKAWMNGLVPYVDFADSKGPLLWLIYGAGYLLSRTNYTGVFWISCFWYTVTCFFTWKTARIFLQDKRKALLSVLLMPLFFFNPWFHDEIRSEDFCLLFMAVSLYGTCRLLYGGPPEEKRVRRIFFALGACFAAPLLIKFSIAAMQAVFCLVALYWLLREKRPVAGPVLYALGGFAAVSLPFVLYLLCSGSFTPFIQEYFIKTLKTVHGEPTDTGNLLLSAVETHNPFLVRLFEFADIFYQPELAALLILLLTGGILFLGTGKKYRWMPLVTSVLVFALSIPHHFYYYFNICSVFLVFFVTGILSVFDRPFPRWSIPVAALAVLCVLFPFYVLTRGFKIIVFNDNENQRDYYRIAYVMSQVEKPRLVNAFTAEFGFGMPAEALPAGKYWTRQTGYSKEMKAEHKALILSGKADFIIVYESDLLCPGLVTLQELEDAGYQVCLTLGDETERKYLLTNRSGLDIPSGPVTPSRKDLLLKRNVFKRKTRHA